MLILYTHTYAFPFTLPKSNLIISWLGGNENGSRTMSKQNSGGGMEMTVTVAREKVM